MQETTTNFYLGRIQEKLQRQAKRRLDAQDSRRTAGAKHRKQHEVKALRRSLGRNGLAV